VTQEGALRGNMKQLHGAPKGASRAPLGPRKRTVRTKKDSVRILKEEGKKEYEIVGGSSRKFLGVGGRDGKLLQGPRILTTPLDPVHATNQST
jgi:hypothetical protein